MKTSFILHKSFISCVSALIITLVILLGSNTTNAVVGIDSGLDVQINSNYSDNDRPTSNIDVNVGATTSVNTNDTPGLLDINIISDGNVNAEVEIYENNLRERDARVTNVITSETEVSIEYTRPGRFLGLIPVSMSATIISDSSGNVAIKNPWYGFMVKKNDAALKSAVEASTRAIINSNVLDIDTSADIALTSQQQIMLAEAIHSAVSAHIEAQVQVNSVTE